MKNTLQSKAGLLKYFIQCCVLLLVIADVQAQTTSMFTDGSLTAKTIAAYGDTKIVAGQSKFAGPVGTFDGAGDYLVVSPSPLDANPKVFTIEAWVYINSVPANGWPIVSQSANGTAGEQQLFISGSNNGVANQNKLRFSRGASATNAIDLIGTTALPVNQWTHVAVSVDGATAKLFVNGNLDASIALTTGWVDTAQPFHVATTLNTTTPQNQSFANGKISDLRVTKNSARYRGSFIPWSSQVLLQENIENYWPETSLILKGEGVNGSATMIDGSILPNSISSIGNAQIKTDQKKYGTSSLFFDGSGDSLILPYNDGYNFGASDFTVEFWVNLINKDSPDGNSVISVGASGGYWQVIVRQNSIMLNSFAGSYSSIVAPVTLENNAWHHVAWTRANGVNKIYYDGNLLSATGSIPANLAFSSSSLYVGSNFNVGSSSLNGYMDDLRITKGISRYVTNFTPSEIPAPPTKTGDVQWSNVSFLVNANGVSGSKNLFDVSALPKMVTTVGDAKITTGQSKFGGAAVLFDGSGDSLISPYDDGYNLRTSDFTVEFWLNLINKDSSDGNSVMSVGTSGGYWQVIVRQNSIMLNSFAGSYSSIVAPVILENNAWHHVAWTRANGVNKIYYDGNLLAATGSIPANLGFSSSSLYVGSNFNVGTSSLNGYMDDLRITKGVVRYTGNFNPPITQFEPARFIKDPYSARVSLLLLSGATAVDSIPPYISAVSKQTNSTTAAMENITLTFSKNIELTSVTPDLFSLTDSSQNKVAITSVSAINSTQVNINFAPAVLAGTYSLKVSPQILSVNGLALDQNRNGIGGEVADSYSQSITVNYATPAPITPTTTGQSSTGTSINLSWPAYVKPVNGKDLTVYRIYTSLRPFTNISQATKVAEVAGTATGATITDLLTNTTYYVAVVPVDVGGGFSATVTSIAVKAITASEQTSSYTYNAAGQILTEDGPRTDVNDITTYTYDSAGNRTSITNALGHVVRYTSYDGAGRLLSMTDANGIISNFSYSDRGWLLSSTIKHPTDSTQDSVTTYTYDAVGQMLTMTLPNNYQLGYEYDDARRLTTIKTPSGERIEYTLDAAGNRTQQKVKSSSGVIVYSVAQAFDELSRVMSITGNHNQNEQHKYDVNDNTTAVIDGRSNKTQQTYDALNRITKIIDPTLKETAFTYDAQNRIKTVTDARNNVTTYTYDGLGNLISQNSPDTGITRFSYDAAGNRTSMQDARGVVVNYTYDAINRLTAVSYPSAATENITYTYDVTATNNYGQGRLNKVTNGSASITYSYNHLGLVNQKITSTSSLARTVTYIYDKSGNLTGITYPTGRIVTYVRDAAGRVQAIKTKFNSAATEQTVISAATYLPFGPINSYTYGNGLTHSLSYDNDYRLTDIVLGGLLKRSYNYDAVDNITGIVDGVSATKTQTFTYDNLDRLTSANGTYGYQAFSYDSVGNRTGFLSDQGNGIQSDTYSYEATSNRLSRIDKTVAGLSTGTRNFSYDNAGNITQGTPETGTDQTYTYNKANRLSTAKAGTNTLGTYVYDAIGQRVSKTYADGSKELFYYDEAGQLISVTNTSGATLREYIYNENTLVGYINAGILTYVHNDHHNTPQVVTAQNQSVLWMADYEPFGKVKLSSGSINFTERFPGQHYDSETGLYQNFFRDYDASVGRYLQSDPIGLRGGINTYAYAEGDPVSNVDPKGLDVTVCHWSGTIPHIGIGVNSDQTVGRRVREGSEGFKWLVLLGWSVPGEVSPDHMKDVSSCKKIPSNNEKDKRVKQCIKNKMRSSQMYNLYGNSCVDFVRECLSTGLGTTYTDTNLPGNLYNEIN